MNDKSVNKQIADALTRLADVAEKIATTAQTTLSAHRFWRWRINARGAGQLSPLQNPAVQPLNRLRGVDEQIADLKMNLKQFLRGEPFNHVLLTGPRGCGKSSVARGVAGKLAKCRLIETDVAGLAALPELVDRIGGAQKVIIYCDDLSFGCAPGKNNVLFNRLKSAVDGSFAGADNFCIVATSNRRHLLPDYYKDNLEAENRGGEIHPTETVEEQIALSDRFGLWIPFFAPSAADYKMLVKHWLGIHNIKITDALITEGMAWADMRGSRNGRIAGQFAVAVCARQKK